MTVAKMFYSIKEVALLLSESEPTLRYWEREFKDVIAPERRNGVRFYTEKDIDNVQLIKYLLRDCGLTLEGARKKLKNNKDVAVRQAKVVRHLKNIRAELKILSESMDEVERMHGAG